MKIFITGATGVLGRPTTRLLAARGHEVWALVRNEERAALAHQLGAHPIVGDLFDAEFVRTALRDVAEAGGAVLHLATAIPKKTNPRTRDWAMNDRVRREGTRNLLEAVRGQKLHSFVLQSIAFLYGDTRGLWKREEDPLPRRVARNLRSAVELEQAGLQAYQLYETPVVILRGALFYGPEAYSTRAMLDAIRHRRLPIIGSGEQYWHYIYVDDMARGCVIAAESPAPGEIFNVADDWSFHARDLLNYLAVQLNAPAPLTLTGAVARLLGGSTAALMMQSARFRTDKIKRMLGWTPQYPTYREGFAEILRQLGKRV